MANIDYDDMAFRICQTIIRVLVAEEFHEAVVERLRKEIEGDEREDENILGRS